jgi:hypothetical protein
MRSAKVKARRARGEGRALRFVPNDPRKQALHLSLIFFWGALVGAGCGPAQQKGEVTALDAVAEIRPIEKKTPPASPASPELPPAERERHIADAAAEVDLAERTVEENLVKERVTPAPPRPPRLPGKPPAPNAEPKEGCERACLAITSMRSAVEHLCRLSGPTDARCRKAQLRLETATSKVVAAACGCSASI